MSRITLFVLVLLLFLIGATLFVIGMILQIPPLYYTAIGILSVTLPTVCYMAWTTYRKPILSEEKKPVEYVYRNPGMKYNKSDSDLQLTAQTAEMVGTADDGSAVFA